LGTNTYFSSTPTTPLDFTRPNKAATGNKSVPQALTQRQAVRLATPKAVPVRR